MELDELKKGWRTSVERIQTPSRDIQSFINNEGGSPVKQLRNRFRRGMILVPVIIAIALSRFSHHHGLAFTLFFSFLLVFALSMTGYFYYNYKLLGKAQPMNVTVKEHLQKQVSMLEKGVRFRLIFTRSMAVLFIVLVEILMYGGEELRGWNSESLITRLAVYAAVFAVFYAGTHLAVTHRYGKHIRHLRELVNELE